MRSRSRRRQSPWRAADHGQTEIELSAGTPAEIAAVKAKVAAIKTRGQARAYIASVMEKVGIAKAQRKAAAVQKA